MPFAAVVNACVVVAVDCAYTVVVNCAVRCIVMFVMSVLLL